ncbi:hypothetical protein T08_4443 [Trichinella sp. T8]|nr:hypothetical protein T08_4443 [Trichinella sp. T8]
MLDRNDTASKAKQLQLWTIYHLLTVNLYYNRLYQHM